MKKTISRISPLSCAKMYALVTFVFTIIVGIILLIFGGIAASLFGGSDALGMGLGIGFFGVILFVVVYTALGFLGGLLGAAFYNLAARWVGGVEITLTDVKEEAAAMTK